VSSHGWTRVWPLESLPSLAFYRSVVSWVDISLGRQPGPLRCRSFLYCRRFNCITQAHSTRFQTPPSTPVMMT
jgi:hypothetical protein